MRNRAIDNFFLQMLSPINASDVGCAAVSDSANASGSASVRGSANASGSATASASGSGGRFSETSAYVSPHGGSTGTTLSRVPAGDLKFQHNLGAGAFGTVVRFEHTQPHPRRATHRGRVVRPWILSYKGCKDTLTLVHRWRDSRACA